MAENDTLASVREEARKRLVEYRRNPPVTCDFRHEDSYDYWVFVVAREQGLEEAAVWCEEATNSDIGKAYAAGIRDLKEGGG